MRRGKNTRDFYRPGKEYDDLAAKKGSRSFSKKLSPFRVWGVLIGKALMNVLIIDDHESARWALTRMLESMNVDVFCAANGREALEMVDFRKIDLIFSDIQMPVMGGLEFARELRAGDPGAKIPLVFMSGENPVYIEKDMQKYAPLGFVAKPIDPGTAQLFVQRVQHQNPSVMVS
jgi:CheY-like chemotaxis protein